MPRNGTSMREEPRINSATAFSPFCGLTPALCPRRRDGSIFGVPAAARDVFYDSLARFLGSLAARCRGGHALLFAGGLRRSFWPLAPWLLATARDIFYNSPAIRSVFFAPLTARCRQGHVLRFPGGLRRFFGSLAAGGCSQGHILQFAGGLRRFLASLAARCSRAMEHGQTVVLHWGIQAAFLAIGGLTTVHYFLHFCRGSLHYLSSSYWGSHYTTSRYPPYKSAPVCLS